MAQDRQEQQQRRQREELEQGMADQARLAQSIVDVKTREGGLLDTQADLANATGDTKGFEKDLQKQLKNEQEASQELRKGAQKDQQKAGELSEKMPLTAAILKARAARDNKVADGHDKTAKKIEGVLSGAKSDEGLSDTKVKQEDLQAKEAGLKTELSGLEQQKGQVDQNVTKLESQYTASEQQGEDQKQDKGQTATTELEHEEGERPDAGAAKRAEGEPQAQASTAPTMKPSQSSSEKKEEPKSDKDAALEGAVEGAKGAIEKGELDPATIAVEAGVGAAKGVAENRAEGAGGPDKSPPASHAAMSSQMKSFEPSPSAGVAAEEEQVEGQTASGPSMSP